MVEHNLRCDKKRLKEK